MCTYVSMCVSMYLCPCVLCVHMCPCVGVLIQVGLQVPHTITLSMVQSHAGLPQVDLPALVVACDECPDIPVSHWVSITAWQQLETFLFFCFCMCSVCVCVCPRMCVCCVCSVSMCVRVVCVRVCVCSVSAYVHVVCVCVVYLCV